jgi:hypothetical protein
MIEPFKKMKKPNESLFIHTGQFELSTSKGVSIVKGDIKYHWFPYPSISFEGEVLNNNGRLLNNWLDGLGVNLQFGSHVAVKCWITSMGDNYGRDMVYGIIPGDVVFGDKSINVEELHFDIPNLKSFLGSVVKFKKRNYSNRLKVADSIFNITLDKVLDYDFLSKMLERGGGYLTLYSGRIKSKKGTISFNDAEKLLLQLKLFLTFINGNQIIPAIIVGKYKGKKIWEYYPDSSSHEFRAVLSWTNFKQDRLTDIWTSIGHLISDPNKSDVLKSAINWYVSANRNAVHAEGAVVMIQNALELLFNVIIVEEKKIMLEEDSEKFNAAAKIRLLLSQFGLDFMIPTNFKDLQKFSDSISKPDAPGTFTEIRNAIVHAQKAKRDKLKSANSQTRIEAKNLGIWYVELAVLYLLKYQGAYKNRCSQKVESVPWAKG